MLLKSYAIEFIDIECSLLTHHSPLSHNQAMNRVRNDAWPLP